MAKKKKSKKKKLVELSHEEYYKHMIDRYGNHAKWGDAIVYLTYDEMIEIFGEQCEDFHPLCENCINWVSWQKTGTAKLSIERDKFMKYYNQLF